LADHIRDKITADEVRTTRHHQPSRPNMSVHRSRTLLMRCCQGSTPAHSIAFMA
jgi:hypothetical protein